MKTTTQHLVDFVIEQKFEKLPKEVIHESKRILLDSIGCAIGGLSIDKGKIAVKIAKEMGGPPEATIIGTGDKVSIFASAFANGELINALDYDYCTIPPGHVTPFTLPATLSIGEKERVTGKELIASIATSHEVSARMATALAYYRDLKPGEKVGIPPVHGYSSTIIGGTLGAGLLQGFDPEKLAYATGIAGTISPAQSMAKWARTIPAHPTKYLLAGWISQAELLAIVLAKHGSTGDVEVLDTDFGFWRFIGSSKWNPDNLMDKLGEEWRFLRYSVYKPYPCCRIMHTVLDCFYHLMDENNLQAEEIEDVKTYADTNCAVQPLWMTKEIVSAMDAQMSMPFIIATAAHRVTIGPEWQDLETLKDPRILAFMDKVSLFPHPQFEQSLQEDSGSRIGKVEITARGRVFSEERKYRKGSHATQETIMTDEELVDKFKHNAGRVLTTDQIDKLPDMILSLEKIDDVSQLAQLW